MTKYRLASAEFVFAPNMVAFAINGAKFEADRQQMIDLVAKGWNIPLYAATELVTEKVPYAVVGDVVTFSVESLQ